MLRAIPCAFAATVAVACAPLSAPPPEVPDEDAVPAAAAPPPLTEVQRAVLRDYDGVVERVTAMVDDRGLERSVARRGLSVVNVAWEDTGRAQGSSLGPNISDLTLQVRRRSESRGGWAESIMPVIRFPNFTDRTADVRADRFFVRVGNERGGSLHTLPLSDLLRDLRRFASAPSTIGDEPAGRPLDVWAARDSHFLVSAQAVFLPIPRAGKAEFNPVVFNYQSSPGSPAVLAILVTREGTSIKVIENRGEDRAARWGQELYFNEAGKRAAFTAERRSDVAARIQAQGGPRTEADRSALGRGADVLALVQVPLLHAHRGVLGGSPDDGYGYEFSDDPLAAGGFGPNDATIRVRPGPVRSGDVERAVLGHGPTLGPFLEGFAAAGRGTKLVRDERFPVRITVQFYKATSDGIVSEAELDGISRSIGSAYEHADFVGSLVVPDGDPRRPTAWQTVPGEWFPW
jgi:hypothetical protein